ncbi:MAG TPA: M48 family metallopeptidase, partial [Cyclobacteriaceae bacterium]
NNFSSKDVNAYAYRSAIPNAACHGNGILSVMLGLLARLDTEDQVAFVICHELAHHIAKDNLRDIESAVELLNDKDTKKSIRQAQRSTYYSYSRTSKILDQLDFTFVSHGRAHEFSADSAGLLLYLKAGYDPASALRLLELLGKADEDLYGPLDLEKFLVSNGIKPDPRWPRYTSITRGHADQKRPDSLRTHPATTERIIAASKILEKLGYTYESLYAPKELHSNPYKIRAQYETVEGEFYFRNYSDALYNSIQLSMLYPNDPWLKAMTGRCLYQIYTRQKNHTLRTSVDLPDPLYSEGYNRLLTFIHGLRLAELESITYQYMTSQPEAVYTNEDFIYSLWLVSSFKISQMDPDKVRDDYSSLFPNGTYLRLMKK